jgi:hypothetical protein
LGQVALIPNQFAKETLGQGRDRTTIIDINRSQATGEDLATVVDYQMELEAVELIDRIRAALGQSRSVAMVLDAAGMTNTQFGGIDEA